MEFICDRLRQTSADLAIFSDGRRIPEDSLDTFIISLEFIFRELLVLDITSEMDDVQLQGIEMVRNGLSTLRSYDQFHSTNDFNSFSQVSPVSTGLVGRPHFDIPCEQLSFLIDNQFTVPQIADLLGISIRTVRRRMSSYGLCIRSQYSDILDGELDEIVREIQHLFPMCGNRQMQGHLLSRRYRVQQSRIRESQRRVDPEGTVLRRLRVLNRREYSVHAPRSLFHIDGHHKLIRYIMLIFL